MPVEEGRDRLNEILEENFSQQPGFWTPSDWPAIKSVAFNEVLAELCPPGITGEQREVFVRYTRTVTAYYFDFCLTSNAGDENPFDVPPLPSEGSKVSRFLGLKVGERGPE